MLEGLDSLKFLAPQIQTPKPLSLNPKPRPLWVFFEPDNGQGPKSRSGSCRCIPWAGFKRLSLWQGRTLAFTDTTAKLLLRWVPPEFQFLSPKKGYFTMVFLQATSTDSSLKWTVTLAPKSLNRSRKPLT